MLANLATSLFEHDRITTTEAKAKRMRPLAERMVTFAKRGDLLARRRVMTVIRDKCVVHGLFVEIGPDLAERPGGYTRITKIGRARATTPPWRSSSSSASRWPRRTVKEAEAATKRSAKDDAAKREAAQEEAKEAAAATAEVEEAPDSATPPGPSSPRARSGPPRTGPRPTRPTPSRATWTR